MPQNVVILRPSAVSCRWAGRCPLVTWSQGPVRLEQAGHAGRRIDPPARPCFTPFHRTEQVRPAGTPVFTADCSQGEKTGRGTPWPCRSLRRVDRFGKGETHALGQLGQGHAGGLGAARQA